MLIEILLHVLQGNQFILSDDELYANGDTLLTHDAIQVIGGKNAIVVVEVDSSTIEHYSYSDYGESTNPNRLAYNGEVQDELVKKMERLEIYHLKQAKFKSRFL